MFPLMPGSKVPLLGSHGHLVGVADADVARACWLKNPTANIGAATGSRSGFWVLDVNPRHGGPAALADLEAEHSALPATIEVVTPYGGRQLFWKWNSEGLEVRNSVDRIGPGLDVAGEGSFVVIPPSRLANGWRYRWVSNGASAFVDAPKC